MQIQNTSYLIPTNKIPENNVKKTHNLPSELMNEVSKGFKTDMLPPVNNDGVKQLSLHNRTPTQTLIQQVHIVNQVLQQLMNVQV